MDNILSLYINSMSINERYNILNQYLPNLSLDQDSLDKWTQKKGLITSKEIDTFLNLQGYKKSIFSHAIKETSDYDILYAKSSNYPKFNDMIIEIFSYEQETQRDTSNLKLQDFLNPFLIYFKKELKKRINQYCSEANIENIVSEASAALSVKLIEFSAKVFVYEINMFKLSNSVEGNSEEDRFNYIVLNLTTPRTLFSLYCKYPVLCRLLLKLTLNFINNIDCMLNNIHNNYSSMLSTFKLNKTSTIESIQFNPHETHQDGLNVSILNFSCGRKLVYKPRNLAILNAYQNLIEFINLHCNTVNLLDLHAPLALVKDNFTLEEYIEHLPCQTKLEVKNFYKRLGQNAYIAYLLRGTDMHMENIIASGEYPYFIDIETLFTNVIPLSNIEQATKSAAFILSDNVTATGILPANTFFANNGYGVDVSALGGKEQKLSKKILGLTNNNSDDIKYDFIDAHLPGAQNVPYIEGQTVNYVNYVNDFIEGFKLMANFFVIHKEIIRKKILPLFENVVVRTLIRNTQNYKNILDMSIHPVYLSSSILRERLFLNLFSLAIKNQAACLSEYSDLLNGDVPIFFNIPTSTSIFDSKGNEIADFFENSALQLVKNKLTTQETHTINKQTNLIKLVTGNKETKQICYTSQIPIGELTGTQHSSDYFLSSAEEIAKYIYNQGIHKSNDKSHCWLHLMSEKSTKLELMNGTLYNGLSGLALFYLYLGILRPDSKWLSIAEEILDNAQTLVAAEHSSNALTGKASTLYTTFKFFCHTQSFKYISIMSDIMNNISITDYTDSFDWINGSLSTLQVLICIYEYCHDIKYLNEIQNISSQLNSIIGKQKNLTIDFGHGIAPLASIFSNLIFTESDKQYQQYLHEVLKFIATNIENIQRNHWCHGAVGIALSLMNMKNSTNYSLYSKIYSYLDKFIKNSSVDCLDILCHGNAGAIDYFIEKFLQYNDKNSLVTAYSIGEVICANALAHISDNETPEALGLFNGLTGIGYELLRLYAPEIVPSVLLLK